MGATLKSTPPPADIRDVTSPPPDEHAGAQPRDAGVSLVEVMVALVMFALLGTAILVTVVAANRVTYEDAARVAATNLAVREMEITRDTFSSPTRGPDRVRANRVVNPTPLPGGTVGQPLVVDKTNFTVVRTAQWSSVDGTASACDSGSSAELAYLKVTIEVTWPALKDRPPVTMTSTMTPPKGTYSALTGHIGLRVIDRLGAPVVGRTVTARSSSGAVRSGDTASDGCVLISFLDAGTWTITLNQPGYVNPAGDPMATATAQVQQGQLWRGTIEYDAAAEIDATFTTQSGWGVPPTNAAGLDQLQVTLGNSALLPSGSRSVPGAGVTRQLRSLWAYPSGYQVWAGGCLDSDPGNFRRGPVDVTPGGPRPVVELPLAPLTVSATANKTITAVHAADTACPDGRTVVLGSVTGVDLRTSLPYGTWKLSRSGSSTTKTITLVAPDPNQEPSVPPPTPPVVALP